MNEFSAPRPNDVVTRDLRHVWHPCSQMKDYETFPPVEIVGASGSLLHTRNGGTLIDATSSWWCKTLGHGHPRLREALVRQAARFEHVIGANTASETLVGLSEQLAGLCPPLDKVFYAGDGSSAVEIALKMSLHAQRIRGQEGRTRFLSLENGYHGESGLSLAVSDLGLYRAPYAEVLPEPVILRGLPYVSGPADPAWNDAGAVWPALEQALAAHADTAAALIVEPVLQGAGGMRVYSPDLLRRLRAWTTRHGVLFVVDEIMTGFWRTGKMLAVDHAGIAPDLMCLSKGLTGGWLPFAATLVHPSVYDLFYADYGQGRDFLHSNTYAGNALGAAVAREALSLYAAPGFGEEVAALSAALTARWEQVATATGALRGTRAVGGLVAADLAVDREGAPRAGTPLRAGRAVFREAVARGALLRPLGDTLYWLPPLNTPVDELDRLAEVTAAAIRAARERQGW
ncbi:MAG TPA: adenosylmethionine--8-amino-7-oxononanoate transaminase [Fibrobacteria bacterium]|nr:adenosylmethionine--8-amino-7-oxononanoate transaminase [Fibrobacteria bacterium]